MTPWLGQPAGRFWTPHRRVTNPPAPVARTNSVTGAAALRSNVLARYGTALGSSLLQGQATSVVITGLYAWDNVTPLTHAGIGATIIIHGSGFGVAQGTVTFGEPLNIQGWAPCTKTATVSAWSETSITVTVPSMSPGKAGETGTYHRVRVYAGGVESNGADFYIDPAIIITAGTTTGVAYGIVPQSQAGWDSGNPHTCVATWDPVAASYSATGNMGVWLANGVHDVLFDGVTFIAADGDVYGDGAGVITMGCTHSTRNITFLNSTIANNTGVGDGSANNSGVNGVKVVNYTGHLVDDISFVRTLFGTPNGGASAFRRMGYEQTEGPGQEGAERVAFIDCTFEPVGGETISDNSGNLYQLISGCTIKGAGNVSIRDYDGVLECNSSRYVEWRNCDVWHINAPLTNINPDLDGGGNDARYILLDDVRLDIAYNYQTVTGCFDCLFMCSDMHGVRYKDCTFNCGSASQHIRWAGMDGGWPWGSTSGSGQWATCTGNDFSGSTISGYYESGRPANTSPGSIYWQAAANQNNTFPTVSNP